MDKSRLPNDKTMIMAALNSEKSALTEVLMLISESNLTTAHQVKGLLHNLIDEINEELNQ